MAGLIDRYRDRLPVSDSTPVVTLGEGNTPLLPAPRISALMGVEVYLKYEGANPTGSFKDRGMTMAVSKALEEGATRGGMRVHRQHLGVGRGLLRAGRHPLGGGAARGRDRPRKARPGPDLRRPRDRHPGQLR